MNQSGRDSESPQIVQFIPKEKFTKGFIRFTNDAFPERGIWFFVYGSDSVTGYERPDASNVVILEDYSDCFSNPALSDMLKSSKLIILNWCDHNLALQLQPYWGKLFLLFWGGDLYPLKKPISITKYREWQYRQRVLKCIKECRGVLTLLPGELNTLNSICKRHGIWHPASVFTATASESESMRREICELLSRDKPQNPIRILLGNSATPTNRHAQMIESLRRFSHENIALYVPLSYGNMEYKDEIIRLGKDAFGEKFIPLIDYMEIAEYQDLLKTISVGVFNHNRQQGMGSIHLLMQYGAKVYIAPDSPMWADFASNGEQFFNTSTINEETYGEFISYDKEYARKNFEALDPIKFHSSAVKKWQLIYAEADT